MKDYKIHDYKGFKIQNCPFGSEPRYFIFNNDMQRQKHFFPKKTLKEAKTAVDSIKNLDN